MTDISSILGRLADSGPIEPDKLQQQLGMTTDRFNDQLDIARSCGLQLDEVKGKLSWGRSVPLLDAALIQQRLDSRSNDLIENMALIFSVDSTNNYLLGLSSDSPRAQVCLAESQTSGRGRRGKHWVSPPCSNVYLSIRQRFTGPIEAVSGLSLGVGLVIAELLAPDLSGQVGLKWPNDLYVDGRKLGGILVELKATSGSKVDVVVGVGLNIHAHEQAQQIDQPWTALENIVHPGVSLNRNLWMIRLLNKLVPFLHEFSEAGADYIHEHWSRFDLCYGQNVSIQSGGEQRLGSGAGIDRDFNFLLKQGDTVQSFTAVEVGLRLT